MKTVHESNGGKVVDIGDVVASQTDAGAGAVIAERLSGAKIVEVGGATLAVLPHGKTVADLKPLLDNWRDRPERVRGCVELTKVESFIAHVQRMGSKSETVVFADDNRRSPSLMAVYDYHEPAATSDHDGQANWLQNRATYQFPVSAEWSAWTRGRDMSQADFAELLEARILDVQEPSQASEATKEKIAPLGLTLAGPGKLIALSRGLKIHVEKVVSNHENLSSGEAEMIFTEEHSDGAGNKIDVPGAFVIAIPVFRGGPRYEMLVRLRYRVLRGRVQWSLNLHRSDLVFEDALGDVVKTVEDQTDVPILFGSLTDDE